MAVITTDASAAHGDEALDDHDRHDFEHHADLTFWKVGGFLATVTAVEVSTIWWKDWGLNSKVTAFSLIVMMTVKFAVVGGYFMHLKWDAIILRRVFMAGIALALGVYLAGLAALTIFDHSGTTTENDPPRVKPLPPPATDPPAVPAVTTHRG